MSFIDDLVHMIIKLESLRYLIEKYILDIEYKKKFKDILIHSYYKRDELEKIKKSNVRTFNKKLIQNVRCQKKLFKNSS